MSERCHFTYCTEQVGRILETTANEAQRKLHDPPVHMPQVDRDGAIFVPSFDSPFIIVK